MPVAHIATMQEEITTIFVVGFPDDMQEREFQNMFTFSSGFEAATLKIPSQTDSDDGTGTNNGRKQIIGFAKFRTRLDALEARDVLSGRKVDAERGCVLKAEMAKKNLHTKRGLSIDHATLANGFGMNPMAHLQRRGSKDSTMFPDPFFLGAPPMSTPPLTRDLFGAPDFPSPIDMCDLYGSQESMMGRTSLSESPYSARAGSFSEFMDVRPGQPGGMVTGRPNVVDANTYNDFLDNGPSPPTTVARSQSFSERGFSSALFSSESLLPRLSILGMNTTPSGSTGSCSGSASSASSSAGTSPTGLGPYGPRSNGDQNPPCNTLYVGNLPHDTSEEELRQLFSRCPGYKRMCFRSRPNGPMCFVEFEDVQCATQALVQLYGNPLSNSTKGGIRLSYSKNPLGVRPPPAGPQPMVHQPLMMMEKESRLIHGH
ncbi:uncharacterized protein SPPG_01052 [Spizellomyces punctatus DAOM BR117]|uniref:RRM domain-containing protein n=1 Tax=Spizellomyces punctatus (strain DAOM BR117) TaxID=645134 RepID=A0A0L0HR86_SPIPD|nr:uncharacterized protein SPPG_01052 [Spizellomyces punctatus DAOM BR117]KND03577.1 hypothetical protein SPPG_01052 [Spizellomyces punctatus DAOM BR117]|eukprot:XP_016611616.1 hypothetical protein SPPG_01052 [Spizellomyces punctatus DAOM BR117]